MEKAEAELCAQNNKSHGFIVQVLNAYICKSYPRCILYTGTSYCREKSNVTHRKEQMLPHFVKNVQDVASCCHSPRYGSTFQESLP